MNDTTIYCMDGGIEIHGDETPEQWIASDSPVAVEQ